MHFLSVVSYPLGYLAVTITVNPTSVGQGILAVIFIVGYVAQHKSSNKKAQVIEEKAEEIHILVNSRLDEALKRIASLENSLNIPEGAPAPAPVGEQNPTGEITELADKPISGQPK